MCEGGTLKPPPPALRPAAGGAQPALPVQIKPPRAPKPHTGIDGEGTVPDHGGHLKAGLRSRQKSQPCPTAPPRFSLPVAASRNSPRTPHPPPPYFLSPPRYNSVSPQLSATSVSLPSAPRSFFRAFAQAGDSLPLPSYLSPVIPTSPAFQPLLPPRARRREPRGVRRWRWSGPGKRAGVGGGGKAAPHTQDGGGGAGVGARDAL